jgi:hypothetical protein
MHWCPQCRRWFHRHCLSSGADCRDASETSSMTVVSEDWIRSTRTRSSVNYSETLQAIHSVARQPIVRGCQYGLVGNAHHVMNARNLLQVSHEAETQIDIPKDWKMSIGLGSSDQVEHQTFPCPVCRNLI